MATATHNVVNAEAFDQLKNNQQQLDQDGVMVGVSRQALDEVLSSYLDLKAAHVGALREALEPFKQAALVLRVTERMAGRVFGDDEPFQSGLAWREGESVKTITYGDFRRARAALTTPAAPVETVAADDDGWIAWEGGSRPVAGFTEVEVKLRDEPGIVEYASRLDWAHFNNESDIVAYRVRPAAGGAL